MGSFKQFSSQVTKESEYRVVIKFTPDDLEQVKKYQVDSGSQSIGFSTWELVKLGLLKAKEIEAREAKFQKKQVCLDCQNLELFANNTYACNSLNRYNSGLFHSFPELMATAPYDFEIGGNNCDYKIKGTNKAKEIEARGNDNA